ncbi:MAG: putative toxin-antitoxin system toxin component, PIN family [Acidobacteriota bacterium]|nr:putative toxin-antitoxin system toxin component, PIN family [Acidobacteriota bacterium]
MNDAPTWVLDTNVLVSGLLSPFGPPGRLVDLVQSGRLRIATDDRIEAEYRDVLARPRLGIERLRREAFLAVLQFQEHVTALPWTHRPPPDPDDNMFLEVALQVPDRLVVTGNVRHFPPGCRGPVAVWSPRIAWERFLQVSRTV